MQNKAQTNYAPLFWALTVLVMIILFRYRNEIQSLKSSLLNIESNIGFYIIPVLIVIGIFLILLVIIRLFYKQARAIQTRIKSKGDERIRLKNEAEEIESLIETKMPIDLKELTNYIETIKDKIRISRTSNKLTSFIPELKKRLAKATELLEELEKENKIRDIQTRTKEVENELHQIEEQKIARLREEATEKWEIIKNLGIKDYYSPENVFKKEKLTKKEIEVLIEEGFQQINDYCIYEQKFTQALVKPILHHTVVHDFLVWGAIKILEENKEVTEIQEHYTRDADITFKFHGKIYALEIETGSLLSKPLQMAGKLRYLNIKYPKRWMFIVSNRNLLHGYRKYGFSTPRNEVHKNLNKLLGI